MQRLPLTMISAHAVGVKFFLGVQQHNDTQPHPSLRDTQTPSIDTDDIAWHWTCGLKMLLLLCIVIGMDAHTTILIHHGTKQSNILLSDKRERERCAIEGVKTTNKHAHTHHTDTAVPNRKETIETGPNNESL